MVIYFGNLGKSSEKTMHNFDTIYSGDYSYFQTISIITINKKSIFFMGKPRNN